MKACSICKQLKPESEFVYRKDRQKRQPHCKACKINIDRAWASANRDRRTTHKTRCDRNRRRNNPSAKLKDRLRTRLNQAIRSYIDKRQVSHIRDLGCSVEELIKHIESQFQPGMSWSNHGSKPDQWEIDHIVPFCTASSKEDLLKIVHYTNLRPLWSKDHRSKSNSERKT